MKRLVLNSSDYIEPLYISKFAVKNPGKSILYITKNNSDIDNIKEFIKFFTSMSDVLVIPELDTSYEDLIKPDKTLVRTRIEALNRINNDTRQKIVIMSQRTANSLTIDPSELIAKTLVLKIGKDVENLLQSLISLGYERTDYVIGDGEFAVRGDVVDIFFCHPYRVSLFDTKIEKIRQFDPSTRLTLGNNIEEIALLPVTEMLESKLSPVISWFGPDYVLFTSGGANLAQGNQGIEPTPAPSNTPADSDPTAQSAPRHSPQHHSTEPESSDSGHAQTKENKPSSDASGSYTAQVTTPTDAASSSTSSTSATLVPYAHEFPDFPEVFAFSTLSDKATQAKKIHLKYTEIHIPRRTNIIDAIRELLESSDKKTILAVQNTTLAARISHMLGLKIFSSFQSVSSCGIALFDAQQSFETENLRIIAGSSAFNEKRGRHLVNVRKEDLLKDINSLLEGDFVVHINHGIGQFTKLTTLKINNKLHDFLEIIYDNEEKLFVPVENINLLSRYGSESAPARLDRLGSKSWQRRSESIRAKIRMLADELIRTAAERERANVEPPAFDRAEFDRFCNNFAHVETDDQNKAIADILHDFESGHLIDRLVCGDVGFGKTEVAMRAAFIISRSKQVCIIVPTTVLCEQHYESFIKRFDGFHTNIIKISRNSDAQAKKLAENGEAKIIIATHAAFKQKFNDLGMIIIDEEQHFGVKQKERLKAAYKDLHVLTLTATPIPRTLQLSISGIKDISIIATPPISRLPARILIIEAEDNIIREAILREVERGGQIFYTCPRIHDIPTVEELLRRAVPQVSYQILHGQMRAADSARTLDDFRAGRFDVLVSTNIIESGVDIPNVNTLVVHNAQNFGLSSLYQLKGRVGRSNQQAFAYLTLPPGRTISKGAERRLKVIQTLEKLGAGFSLASYDMDIRGAGNVLGEEQSGHIKEIGVDLYQKMLKSAIENTQHDEDIKINLNIPVLIPSEYIKSADERISYYQRISASASHDELYMIKKELEDQFGRVPPEALNLLYVVGIKNRCRTLSINKVESGPKGTLLYFVAPSNIEQILEVCRNSKGLASLRDGNKVLLKQGLGLNEFLKKITISELEK